MNRAMRRQADQWATSNAGPVRLGARPYALVGKKHPALHTPAGPVLAVDDEIRVLVARMFATVHAVNGIALAAPQVGIPLRLIVSRDGNVSVNPVLRGHSETTKTAPEGCLSLPGRHFDVARYTKIQGAAVVDGSVKEFTVDGALARVWQHELDHLDGILISDRWPETRRSA